MFEQLNRAVSKNRQNKALCRARKHALLDAASLILWWPKLQRHQATRYTTVDRHPRKVLEKPRQLAVRVERTTLSNTTIFGRFRLQLVNWQIFALTRTWQIKNSSQSKPFALCDTYFSIVSLVWCCLALCNKDLHVTKHPRKLCQKYPTATTNSATQLRVNGSQVKRSTWEAILFWKKC